MKQEYKRKIFHMVLGVVMGLLFLYFRKRYLVAFITGILCGGLVARLLLLKGVKLKILEPFIDKFGRPLEFGLGAMNFFIGALITVLFFSREYAAIGVIVLGVSDGFATIMGYTSKHKVYMTKTFEGTMAFFVSSFIIILAGTTLFQALFVSIILSLVELIAPVDDNLLIPPTCALLLHLTTW